MEYVRFAVKFTAIALLFGAIAGYAYLVSVGDLPRPDLTGVGGSLNTGGSVVLFLVVAVLVVLAAMAPIVYAARSGDVFTFLICIVALVVCIGLFIQSRTVMDQVLAAIVYFTSAFIAVIVFAAARIEAAIKGGSAGGERHAGPIISRSD